MPMAQGRSRPRGVGLEGARTCAFPTLRCAVDFVECSGGWRRRGGAKPPTAANYALGRPRSDAGTRRTARTGSSSGSSVSSGQRTAFLVEIGASDGEENCTRSLVEAGWSGIWIEADSQRAGHARERRGRPHPSYRCSRPSRTTIADDAEASRRAKRSRFAGPGHRRQRLVGSLRGASGRPPRVLVVEYNSTYRPGRWWVEPYRQGRTWDQSFRHGASLDAMASLAATFGLVLMGCDSTGVNSFYISRRNARARRPEAPGGIRQSLPEGRGSLPNFGEHSRQRHVGRNTPPGTPLSDAELRQISLKVNRWPTSKGQSPRCRSTDSNSSENKKRDGQAPNKRRRYPLSPGLAMAEHRQPSNAMD